MNIDRLMRRFSCLDGKSKMDERGSGKPLSPKSFLEGAVLFFVMSIASYVMWAKTEKS